MGIYDWMFFNIEGQLQSIERRHRFVTETRKIWIMKPHLKKFRGEWICEYCGCKGCGKTAEKAWNNFVSHAMWRTTTDAFWKFENIPEFINEERKI